MCSRSLALMFDSLTDLQSSQTYYQYCKKNKSLIPLLIYKALKHSFSLPALSPRLIPLLIYKALKQAYSTVTLSMGLIPLLIYKALKQPDGYRYNLTV